MGSQTHSRGRGKSGQPPRKPPPPDIEAVEKAVAGTLLSWNGDTLAPSLAALLRHAPGSFQCLTLGEIAAAVRALRQKGEPVHELAVFEALGPEHPGTLLLGELPDLALGAAAAELEAARLLEAFRHRRVLTAFREGAQQIEADPMALDAVIAGAVEVFSDLQGEAPATEGQTAWLSLAQDAAGILDSQIDPPVEIVSGLVTEACKFLLGGGSKSFKTWLLLDLALSIAAGTPFLGRPTLKRRVLFANFELRAPTFGRRLQSVAKAKGIDLAPGDLTHLPLRGQLSKLPLVAIVERLLDAARHFDAQVVALDPLYKLNAGGDENDAGAVTVLFNELDRLTTEAGLTVLGADHAGKGNQSEKDPLDVFRGSSAKGADVDGAFVMRRHEVADCFRVDCVLRELPPVPAFVLGWQFPTFAVREDLDADRMKKHPGGRAKQYDVAMLLGPILDISQDDPISVSRWADRLGVPRSTLKGYVPDLRTKGLVASGGDGYFLTPAGRTVAKGRGQ